MRYQLKVKISGDVMTAKIDETEKVENDLAMTTFYYIGDKFREYSTMTASKILNDKKKVKYLKNVQKFISQLLADE